ncbi:beta-galactosidase trimerization domain-containing protein [Gemmatimonadota bacterium]
MRTHTLIIAGIIGLLFISPVKAERTYYQPQRAGWLDKGLILNGPSHEAYIFRVRRGGSGVRTDEWQYWLKEHDENTVLDYRDEGVEVFHSHGYKGFGFEAEKDEMAMLKDLSKLVHKHGMKLDTYCQVMTLVPETFFAEEPRAENWVQRDHLGTPILLTYGYQHSYRYKPNLAHPEYRKYYKEKIIKTLVDECKTDLLHLDNFDCNEEPESDHSPVTVKAFRDYLRKKYNREQMLERFGHTNIHLIDPPLWNQTHNPRNIKVIRDPVQQEWIDFRCWVMADFLKDVSDYARSLNPEVALDVNPHGLFGRNRAFNVALWHPWFMKYTEIIWSEEINHADYNDMGVMISKIRTYKLGRALDNYILTYKGSARMLAEGLAFNQTLGNIGSTRNSLNKRYYDFYQANRELYNGTRNREDAALLRSYHTMAYDNHRAELEMSMFEQAMIQEHVPFDIVFDEQMDDLSRYKVLVLVGQNNLSEKNVERVKRFVDAGGGLVVTGSTSRYDKWGRRKPRPGLTEVMGIDETWFPGGGPEQPFSGKIKITGGGRMVYLPEIIPPDREQAANWRGSWDGDSWEGTWILPSNRRELAWAVRQAAGGSLSLEVDIPDWVAVEQVEKEGLILIHLINYRQENVLNNLPVDVRIDAGKKVNSVSLISPDRNGSSKLEYKTQGDRCRFIVPLLEVYDVVIIRLDS